MLVPYDPAYFRGSNYSYAGQRLCSSGDGKHAMFMLLKRRGKATRAYCNDCANIKRLREVRAAC